MEFNAIYMRIPRPNKISRRRSGCAQLLSESTHGHSKTSSLGHKASAHLRIVSCFPILRTHERRHFAKVKTYFLLRRRTELPDRAAYSPIFTSHGIIYSYRNKCEFNELGDFVGWILPRVSLSIRIIGILAVIWLWIRIMINARLVCQSGVTSSRRLS